MGAQQLNGSAENGAGADPLEHYVAELEAMLPAITAERAQIEAHLSEIAERERRIKDGIAVLRGKGQPEVPATPKRSGRPPTTGKQVGKPQAPPSERLIATVYAVLEASEVPLSVNQITERVDVTRSAVDNTVRYLRSAERVRIAKREGVTQLYAVMA